MAHVLLPCDLPNWITVKKYLTNVSSCKSVAELIPCMKKIYDLCSISLDPDELIGTLDSCKFDGFRDFLLQTLTTRELSQFFENGLPCIADHAINLQDIRPASGLQYCLQQQNSEAELSVSLATSLLACSFFSIFPKRTAKTHPTLNNFNFSDLYCRLSTNANQRHKLRAVLKYFERIHSLGLIGSVRFCRRVDDKPSSVSDWLDCKEPLCDVAMTTEPWKYSEIGKTHVCFCDTLQNGSVLVGSHKTEADILFGNPELLAWLLFMESTIENEVITIHRFGTASTCPELSTTIPPDTSYVLLDQLSFQDENSVLESLNQATLALADPWLYDDRIVKTSKSSAPKNKEAEKTVESSQQKNFEESDLALPNKEAEKRPKMVFSALDPRKQLSAIKVPLIESPIKTEVRIAEELLEEDCEEEHDMIPLSRSERGMVTALRPMAFEETKPELLTLPSVSEVDVLQKSTSATSFRSCMSNPSNGDGEEDDDDDSSFFSACQSLDLSDDDEGGTDDLTSAVGRRLLAESLSSAMTTRRLNQISDPMGQYAVNVEIQGPEVNDDRDIFRLSRASSRGFVLDGSEGGSDDELDFYNGSRHSESSDLCDRRHRRMRRQFFSRSSRMSSTDSRFSSDFDDDDDDDDDDMCEYATYTGGKGRYSMIRKANSEPLLPSMTSSNIHGVEDNLVMIARRLQMASSANPANFVTDIIGGRLKSYSFDGVNANLPVPYRAKFRQKNFPNRKKYPDHPPTRSTYSPLKMSGSLSRRRHLFGRSRSESLPTGSSLSREVLEEEEEEEESESTVRKLSGNLTNIQIHQELVEIKESLPLRPDSVSDMSETNTLVESSHLEVPPTTQKKKMFYVQSTETFDSSDEEFDMNFMKKLEMKAAALSASQEFSRGLVMADDETDDSMKRPTSLSSLQKSVMLNPDEDHGGALRKWKAATNLQDLLTQYSSEDDDEGEDDAVPLELLMLYESIADEMVFDAFCDAFLVLTEHIYKPGCDNGNRADDSTTLPVETSGVRGKQPEQNVQPKCSKKQLSRDLSSVSIDAPQQTKPVVGGSHLGGSTDSQMMSIIQWIAASQTRAPKFIYHVNDDHNVHKLDVIVKTLRRRGWTVGDLSLALFRYCETVTNMSSFTGPRAAPIPLYVYLLDCATRRSSSSDFSNQSSTESTSVLSS